MNREINRPTPPSMLAQIGGLYHKIHRGCDKIFKEQGFPLQMDQIPVLLKLYYTGSACQQEMCHELGRDKASINRTVAFLLKNDIVRVIQDKTDRRKTLVELTTVGEGLAKQADITLRAFDETFSSRLTEEETKQLNTMLFKLSAALAT